jgi:hypothetical protein
MSVRISNFRPEWTKKEGKTYLVFVIFMQVYATLLPSLPLYGNTRVDVRLMYDLRYQLCSIIDKV